MSAINITVAGSGTAGVSVSGGDSVNVNVGDLLPLPAELRANATHVQWKLVASSSWTDLVPLTSLLGPPNTLSIGTVAVGPTAAVSITGSAPSQTLSLVLPALRPEFQSTGSYLQWRLVGDTAWNNLVPISSIVGPMGPSGSGVRIGTVLALS
jgi:hypothetical protein